jgi:catechol 2,3-dioxygenase-like lactoylglutathione lyase family enzyme
MRIEHVALWTHQLEVMRDFYVEFFGGVQPQDSVVMR